MGPTYKIAEMLKISPIAATAYCERVRSLSGLGSALRYKTISQNLAQHLSEMPSPERLAKIIRGNKPVPLPVKSSKPNETKARKMKSKPTVRPRSWNISRFLGREKRLHFDEPAKPASSPSYFVRTSYFDYERVSEEKLEKCPHGVPRFRVCAICDPEKFREMTGID